MLGPGSSQLGAVDRAGERCLDATENGAGVSGITNEFMDGYSTARYTCTLPRRIIWPDVS
jgi:hypothetical protein